MQYKKSLEQIPADIVNLDDYERLAKDFITPEIFAYFAGGASDEITLKKNRSAFSQYTLNPRVLQKFASADTAIDLLGHSLKHPLLLAPVAYQKLVHPQGELATAQAAHAMQAGLISSTLSSCSMEEVSANTDGPKWFQLYFQEERDFSLSLIRRAERAAYTAIVVTVDAPVTGLRYREQRAGFALPGEMSAVNLIDKPPLPPRTLLAGQSIILNGVMADAPNWQDLQWLRQHTDLPILVKGIMHPQDALRVVQMGLDAVIVSNHGGRSLDGVAATIDVLASIRCAVGDNFPLLLDSGIRRGSDIYKALALGANAVLVGRPHVFALAVAGALGVAHALRLLHEELEMTMALSGCPTIASIGPHCIGQHH